MYIAHTNDVRTCSSQPCHAKTTSQRKNWRIQLRTVYKRSLHRPCFHPIPCIQDMSLRKSGYRAASPSVVSTTICTKLFKLQAVFSIQPSTSSPVQVVVTPDLTPIDDTTAQDIGVEGHHLNSPGAPSVTSPQPLSQVGFFNLQ